VDKTYSIGIARFPEEAVGPTRLTVTLAADEINAAGGLWDVKLAIWKIRNQTQLLPPKSQRN
jgi:hypothetical protein